MQWDEAAPDLATAQTYTYRHYDDGALTGVVYSGVICVDSPTSGVYVCTVPLDAYTPGTHTLTLTAASDPADLMTESPHSAPLSFTFVVVPSTPASLRIV